MDVKCKIIHRKIANGNSLFFSHLHDTKTLPLTFIRFLWFFNFILSRQLLSLKKLFNGKKHIMKFDKHHFYFAKEKNYIGIIRC